MLDQAPQIANNILAGGWGFQSLLGALTARVGERPGKGCGRQVYIDQSIYKKVNTDQSRYKKVNTDPGVGAGMQVNTNQSQYNRPVNTAVNDCGKVKMLIEKLSSDNIFLLKMIHSNTICKGFFC
jgi:hypothetical protein